MSLPRFTLARPNTVDEAAALLARDSIPTKILAGGTDLLPSMKQRLFTPACLVDLSRIEELRSLAFSDSEGLVIGAMVRLRDIENSPVVQLEFPLLAAAARTIASPVLRNMGTIGGNLCLDTRCVWYNQSYQWRASCGFCLKKDGDVCHVAPGGTRCWAAFSGDTAPALLVLQAQIEIASSRGRNWLPLADLYTGNGDSPLHLSRDELITRIRIPAENTRMRGAYRKFRVRGSIDYPLAGVAVGFLQHNGRIEKARIALTALNPAPRLVDGVDAALARAALYDDEVIDQLVAMVNRTAKPLTTSALTPEYRRELVKVYTRRALQEARDNGS
jgi:4-hydroxybenzoyl-CoA reductase subunit beta